MCSSTALKPDTVIKIIINRNILKLQLSLDCSNYTDLLIKINSGNGSDYSADLEAVWNATSGHGKPVQTGSEAFSARDILLECLRADFK